MATRKTPVRKPHPPSFPARAHFSGPGLIAMMPYMTFPLVKAASPTCSLNWCATLARESVKAFSSCVDRSLSWDFRQADKTACCRRACPRSQPPEELSACVSGSRVEQRGGHRSEGCRARAAGSAAHLNTRPTAGLAPNHLRNLELKVEPTPAETEGTGRGPVGASVRE